VSCFPTCRTKNNKATVEIGPSNREREKKRALAFRNGTRAPAITSRGRLHERHSSPRGLMSRRFHSRPERASIGLWDQWGPRAKQDLPKKALTREWPKKEKRSSPGGSITIPQQGGQEPHPPRGGRPRGRAPGHDIFAVPDLVPARAYVTKQLVPPPRRHHGDADSSKKRASERTPCSIYGAKVRRPLAGGSSHDRLQIKGEPARESI